MMYSCSQIYSICLNFILYLFGQVWLGTEEIVSDIEATEYNSTKCTANKRDK